jgi:hypothetical protein
LADKQIDLTYEYKDRRVQTRVEPGGFADTPPITLTGRLIATVIGILGIAIFAVPAGLIGSAFTEVMPALMPHQ